MTFNAIKILQMFVFIWTPKFHQSAQIKSVNVKYAATWVWCFTSIIFKYLKYLGSKIQNYLHGQILCGWKWISIFFLWFGWADPLIESLSIPLTILIGSVQNNPDNFIQISQRDSEFGQASLISRRDAVRTVGLPKNTTLESTCDAQQWRHCSWDLLFPVKQDFFLESATCNCVYNSCRKHNHMYKLLWNE